MFKLSVEVNGDEVHVITEAKNETLFTIYYAMASAIVDISKRAGVSVSEIIHNIKMFTPLANYGGSKDE